MTRILLALLLAASPALAQVAPPDASTSAAGTALAEPPPAEEMPAFDGGSVETPVGSSGETPAEPAAEDAPFDPVAAWQADPSVILGPEGLDLAAFEYLARPMVVFADSARQPQFIEQMRMIETALDDLAAREVAVIVDTDPDARSDLRRELRPRGFGVVLVDKDGRVTLRRPAPTPVREFARAIDRTPIRQEELREGRGTVTGGE